MHFFTRGSHTSAHIPNSDKKQDFERMWKNLSNGSIGLNSYGLYAYDIVWMIARALESFSIKAENFLSLVILL
ncbi:putative periplasmic binding protein-like I [Helianthus annuus]|nr:putative periplasmic binding protein-like I [Helianthus annuus]KAJ0518519.1 putative periplasmic binding protein-like I [Helianthus annuus]KAJ0686555.1 putative periplasmic binding protein-like I [Helianthus annuus]KAJ0690370.1 putative periplasmic binding protein-like I [Helianthus annuus]KAJ0871896.1 putative periplasmic binding protein-like I [Helianthus annuus]